MKGKKRIQPYIPEKLYSKLWDHIHKKYEKETYGALSIEVENALERYLASVDAHTNAHTFSNFPNITRDHRVCEQLIYYLKNRGFVLQCSQKDIEEAIKTLKGSDSRTVEKWLKRLVELRYIKHLYGMIYQIGSDAQILEEEALVNKVSLESSVRNET